MDSNRIKLETDEECEFNDQTNRLELEDICNIVNNIILSVPKNDDSVDTDAKEILECHQNYEKMKTEEKICRFCFKMCCNFKAIDGDIKDISKVLLPGTDIAATQEPVMCTHCEEVLFMSFDFKARCLYTHDYLFSFVNQNDDGVKLNLKEIYITKHKRNIIILEDQNICGFCMCPVKNCSAIYLGVGERGVMLKKTLGQCLPELDLSIIEKPVICAPCHASLENHSRFVTNILIGEGKITKYKESLDVNSKSPIDLSSLLQLILSEVDGNGADVIKLENMSCDHSENVNRDIEDKHNNSMDIVDLKYNNEQNSTPTNMLDREIKSNEIGGIEINETFCGEDRIEFKEENIVEVEDRKILFDEEIDIKTDELDFNSVEDGTVMTQLNARINGEQEHFVVPNFVDNLSKTRIEQTCINKNVAKITYPYECAPFKTENKNYLKTLEHMDRSEMTIYKCPSCSFQTNYKDSLNIHLLRHNNLFHVTMYKCHFCTYQTKYKGFLKNHLMEHKNPEVTMLKCDSCLYQTKYKSRLKRHLLIHKIPAEVTMRKFDSCDSRTIHKGSIKTHLLKHKDISEVKKYKCDSCLYKTIHKSELNRHLLTHKNLSEVTVHKCDSCSYQTIRKDNLKTHLLKHKDISEVTVYKCDSCLFQAKHKSAVKKHLLKHKSLSEVTMHKCDSCAYQTIHKSNLESHLLTHKDISEVTTYKCDSCLYQAKHKSLLKKHSLKHKNISEVTMHKCYSCAYKTIYKHSLKRHLLTHKIPSGITIHKCDSCAYRTIVKSSLKRHLLTHKNISEVTVYKCDSCLYQTKYKAGLKTHLLKHKNSTELSMHKCDSCAYQTIHKGNFEIHLLKHKNISEVTMYKCNSCLYQTKYKMGLKSHLLKHKNSTELSVHKCDSCTYQTIYKGTFITHLLKHKNISEVTMYKCDSCLYQTKYKTALKTHLLKHKNSSKLTAQM